MAGHWEQKGAEHTILYLGMERAALVDGWTMTAGAETNPLKKMFINLQLYHTKSLSTKNQVYIQAKKHSVHSFTLAYQVQLDLHEPFSELLGLDYSNEEQIFGSIYYFKKNRWHVQKKGVLGLCYCCFKFWFGLVCENSSSLTV